MRSIVELLGGHLCQRVSSARLCCSRRPKREISIVLTAAQHWVLFRMRLGLRPGVHMLLDVGEGLREWNSPILLLKRLHKVVRKVAMFDGITLERLLVNTARGEDNPAASLLIWSSVAGATEPDAT